MAESDSRIDWVESIGRYLSYLVDDKIEEYAYDIVDSIAKARNANELLEGIYRAERLKIKLKRKAETENMYFWEISDRDTRELIRKLEEIGDDQKNVRKLALTLGVWAFAWYGDRRETGGEARCT